MMPTPSHKEAAIQEQIVRAARDMLNTQSAHNMELEAAEQAYRRANEAYKLAREHRMHCRRTLRELKRNRSGKCWINPDPPEAPKP